MINFNSMQELCEEMNALRLAFPEVARELDDCLFRILQNHTPKCGHGTCSCQMMNIEHFHIERSFIFDSREKGEYETN